MRSIASRLLALIDGIQRAAAALAAASVAVLIGLMLLEVFKRYVLGSPSVWSYELAGIVNGAVFVFAAGYAVQTDGHVAVDAVSRFLPPRVRRAILGVFLLAVLAPLLGWIASAGLERSLAAFARGEVDDVSPWRRAVWPHFAMLTLGFYGFAAAAAARGARLLAGRSDA